MKYIVISFINLVMLYYYELLKYIIKILYRDFNKWCKDINNYTINMFWMLQETPIQFFLNIISPSSIYKVFGKTRYRKISTIL